LFRVKLGTYDYRHDNEPGEVIVNVKRIYKHPQYGTPHQFSHDIAILQVICLYKKSPLRSYRRRNYGRRYLIIWWVKICVMLENYSCFL
jgi:hypothetical protein